MAHPHDRIVNLARSFPVLRAILDDYGMVDGTQWDPVVFDSSVARAGCNSAYHSAAFVLEIWNGDYAWKVGKFSLSRAFACWDLAHRDAFSAWGRDPWLP